MMRRILYVVLLGLAVVMVSSCGGSKQYSSMKKIEKHSKKYPVGEDGLPVPARNSGSKKVKQTLAKQQKQKEIEAKEAEKAHKDAITRHRSFQTQETRDRMDKHLKESEKKYSNKKEFFVVRWFRQDNIEKMEKRHAKDVQKRMAATRKKSEKTNKELGLSRVETVKDRKARKTDPRDVPQGGGGSYREGSAKNFARPSDMQQGGGGSYTGEKSSSRARVSDIQQGGGGTYQSGNTRNRQTASDFQQGGGGTYQSSKSANKQKAADQQQGGGGNMSGKSKKQKKNK